MIIIPFAVDNVYLRSAYTMNGITEERDSFGAVMEGWRNYDTFSRPEETWSFWTPAITVPEPETYKMMLVGLGLMASFIRRRNAKQTV